MDPHACLADPARYLRQIEKLHEKHLETRRLYELRQSEVSLASFVLNRAKVARLLAESVSSGHYELGPARIRTIVANGKERVVFAYPLTDLIVHAVVAGILEEAVSPLLSPSLHSYRSGASWWTAVSGLAAYVRAHAKSRPDVRSRGIYVLRRDIESYTDSIPVGGRSPVWVMLRQLFESGDRRPIAPAQWRLIESVVRPEAYVRRRAPFTQYRGVPTGQPISCVLFNLYLSGLDAELSRIPGSFYARYCDDLVFAHPDIEVARAADALMREAIGRLSLAFNEEKSRDLYLTGAGRAAEPSSGARGTTMVPFLGCLVSAQGTVSLSRQKRRRLVGDLRRRALRTAKSLRGADPDAAGRIVCAVVNRALAARLEPSQQRSAGWVRRVVTDRGSLKQLDYGIALGVLEAITGERGPRAFRHVSYAKMRREWKLISLFHARNRWSRGRKRAAKERV